MIDKEKIPEPTYKSLVDLFGVEMAEKIIIKNQYQYRRLSWIILEESLIRYLGLENSKWLNNKFRWWIIKILIVIIFFGLVFTFA